MVTGTSAHVGSRSARAMARQDDRRRLLAIMASDLTAQVAFLLLEPPRLKAAAPRSSRHKIHHALACRRVAATPALESRAGAGKFTTGWLVAGWPGLRASGPPQRLSGRSGPVWR